MEKRTLGAVLVTVVGAVVIGITTPGFADKPSKPPKLAIDQIRGQLNGPPADPDQISGPLRPGAPGIALVLRDPQTGNVLRDPDGKPMLARNPDGSLAQFTPDQIPPDQLQAQARHEEKVARANNGDVKAKAELADEEKKTADAVKAK